MSGSAEQMFNRIFFFGSLADYTFAASGLNFKSVRRQPFNITVLSYHNHGSFIRNQILCGKLANSTFDYFSFSFIAIFSFKFNQIFLN